MDEVFLGLDVLSDELQALWTRARRALEQQETEIDTVHE
jgi:hypothetical protein